MTNLTLKSTLLSLVTFRAIVDEFKHQVYQLCPKNLDGGADARTREYKLYRKLVRTGTRFHIMLMNHYGDRYGTLGFTLWLKYGSLSAN